MAAITRLGGSGYGTRRTGDFSGKQAEVFPVVPTTFTYAASGLEAALSAAASISTVIIGGSMLLGGSA